MGRPVKVFPGGYLMSHQSGQTSGEEPVLAGLLSVHRGQFGQVLYGDMGAG